MTKQNEQNNQLPVAKNEDVEFSSEIADRDDMEAVQRAHAADARQEQE
ncbi:YfhD family protein [Paenibacillus hexagrammi]|uniref:YfhD family protein n=1 Tax=Paenibacillus hexagrammi TaxID=2908839 RepID=A0ABY3SLX7_9BACL|nr:YfhD family protein [Paenibacillus sp. YPD9-1]UJF35054.1 YfhD family protein [Paenibacillus sp. YPD9-1]